MKRRDFLTSVAIGAAAGSMVTIPGCLPHEKEKNGQPDEDSEGKVALKETYSGSQRVRSGIALGGLGTGSIELRKNGQFYNWSIMNNYPFGAGPVFTIPTWPRNDWEDSLMFFLLRYQVEGEDPKIKLLQINDGLSQGGMDSIEYYFPWMSPVTDIEYRGRFPFVNMKFSDPEMPFTVELEAFTPFIPHDVKNSSLPGVYFNFRVTATGDKPADVMLLGSMRNLVSYDNHEKYFTSFLKEEKGFKYYD
ncbi:MAG TPA: GH116 family glycosyl-hydrolase, partial [Bacteroidales bacterium]|nr:GH116 family glycosyl-hydrolase [Bacteroidales bacterium]